MMKPGKNKKRGYSLIEAVIYVAVLSFISVVAINSIILFQNIFLEMKKNRNLNSAAELSMGRILKEVKNATETDSGGSVFDTSPGRLTVSSLDSSGAAVTAEFYVENGVLKIRENGADKGALLPASISLDSLVFRQISGTRSRAVKIEMSLRDSRGKNPLIKNFYSTAVLRGSY